MKSDEFIDRLEREGAVSRRLVAKLREKLADSGGRLPAKSLAEFLVQKRHLSAEQADLLLQDPAVAAEATKAATDDTTTPREPVAIREVAPRWDPEAESGEVSTGTRIKSKSRRGRPVRRKKNEWDSPLLLLGGGGLVLLLICGVTVYFLLFRDTGDDLLALARTAMSDGSYSQAISQYERFLDDFSGHPEESNARVELAMARLRRATEGRTDYKAALEIAQSSIDQVENESSFPEAHDELATLLPRIAQGLANEAEAVAADPAAATPLVEQANRALELCANNKYVPRALRDEGELQAIRDTLSRVVRRKESYDQLQQTITRMTQATESGDTRVAYEAHRELIKRHPQLSGDPSLLEVVAQTSAAEQDDIHFLTEEQLATTDERPSDVNISLALGHHRGGGQTQGEGTVSVHVDGAIYGLEASTGRLRWRRFVGFAQSPAVQQVGEEIFVRDTRHDDLLKLNQSDGRLLWRQPIGEPFAEPLVWGDRIFVATDSGKLHVVDRRSGTRAGYLQFAQKLPVTPTAGRDGDMLYVVGDHSSLYSISLKDFRCLGVRYVGHSPGSIRVPAVAVSNKLAVFENRGVESSRLRMLSLDNNGAAAETLHEDRLDGLVSQTPLAAGRRLVVLTDLGEMNVYEVGPHDDSSAVAVLASRPATHKKSLVQYPLLADSYIWIADNQLSKYAVQPTENRLPAISIAQNYSGASFDHPLQRVGNAVVHVRRSPGRRGATVSATEMSSGRPLWEIDLAIAPAGPPTVDSTNSTLVSASANGSVFVLDRAAISRRVADQPEPARGGPSEPPQLTSSLSLDGGKALYASTSGSPWMLSYDPSRSSQPVRWLELPGPPAAPPTPLANGCIVPLEIGQAFFVDPTATDPLVAVFQPPLAPQTVVPWLPAARVADSTDQCVLADGHGRVFLLRLESGSPPTLSAPPPAKLDVPLDTRVAVLGSVALAGKKEGGLARLSLPALDTLEPAQLSGRVTWGPFVVDGRILVATDGGQLHSLDAEGQSGWQVPLAHGELTGEPLAAGDAVVIAYENGHLQKLELATGKEVQSADVGQPLAAGPIRLQSRLVLAGHDGTLLVVNEL